MLRQQQRLGQGHLLLVELLLLSFCALAIQTAHASPVSNPDIASKTIKTANSLALHQHQHQHQQHQHQQHPQHQQQQKQQQQLSAQDAHLNSLTAYATNFDNIGIAQAQTAPQPSQESQAVSLSSPSSGGGGGVVGSSGSGSSSVGGSFKPSYKMPEMETNFTPIHSSSTLTAASGLQTTPMIMQYLPAQTLQEGGVQYLQLIPTRPIIVPISPYMTGSLPTAAAAPASAGTSLYQANTANLGNSLADYVPAQPTRTAASTMLAAALPASGGVPGLPYAGLHAYANSIVPYRNAAAAAANYHRINRETKEKHFPMLSLNLNEYLPGPREHTHIYMRARP